MKSHKYRCQCGSMATDSEWILEKLSYICETCREKKESKVFFTALLPEDEAPNLNRRIYSKECMDKIAKMDSPELFFRAHPDPKYKGPNTGGDMFPDFKKEK